MGGFAFFALECAKGAVKRRLYARHGDPRTQTLGGDPRVRLNVFVLPGLACAQMKYVETEQLRLIYFAGTDYLVPYATQSFINALRAQKSSFGYVPDGKVAVLLQDFCDCGNAAMLSAPRNRDLHTTSRRLGLTFETFSPGERTVYVRQSRDKSTSSPATAQVRRGHGRVTGSVARSCRWPTTPRQFSILPDQSPQSLAALVPGRRRRVHGNLDGRRPRPRPGRLRRNGVSRDGARRGATFTTRSASCRKAPKSTSRSGANAYLYGTRFMSYLALQYSPEKSSTGCAAPTAPTVTTPRISNACLASRSTRRGRSGLHGSTNYSRPTWRSMREHPITPYRKSRAAGLARVARAISAPTSKRLCRRPLSRACRHTWSHFAGRRYGPGACRDEGRDRYRVTSLAYDPETQTLFYTTDNLRLSQPDGLRHQDRPSRAPCSRQRASATSRSMRADRSLWGLRTTTASPCSCASLIPTRNGSPCTSFRSAKCRSTSTFPRTARTFRTRSRVPTSTGRRADHAVARHEHRAPAGGRRDACASTRTRHCSAGRVRVFAGRPLPVRQLLLHRRLEHLPLRTRDGQARSAQQRRGRFFPAGTDRRATSC